MCLIDSHRENILEKVVDIGRHIVLRLRVVESIEHLALSISDPLIQVSQSLRSIQHLPITAIDTGDCQ